MPILHSSCSQLLIFPFSLLPLGQEHQKVYERDVREGRCPRPRGDWRRGVHLERWLRAVDVRTGHSHPFETSVSPLFNLIRYNLPQDYNIFVEEFKRNPSAMWIMKPNNSSQGKVLFAYHHNLHHHHHHRRLNEATKTTQPCRSDG